MKSKNANLLPILLLAALALPYRLIAQGYIYNYAGGGNGAVTDITGTTAQVSLFFENVDTNAQTDHPIPPALLPQNARQALTTPLNKIFDQLWNGTPDNSGKTMQNRATAQAISQIKQSVKTQGFDATNISGGFPNTGSLRALVLVAEPRAPTGMRGPTLVLSYWLPGANFTFNAGPANVALWRVTFDTELLILIDFENWGPTPNWFSPRAAVTLQDANISAANTAAGIEEGAIAFKNFVSFNAPTLGGVFEAGEGQIDSTGGAPPNLGQLTTLINGMSGAAVPQGFMSCVPIINPNTRTLTLRLVHPVDPAPVLVTDSTLNSLSFLHPTLATSQNQVKAGTQLTVYGSYFPANQDTQIGLDWNDVTSGRPAYSTINWGFSGQAPQSIQVNRQASNNTVFNGNRYVMTNLNGGAAYQFQVRECDTWTCSGWSNVLNLTTQPTNVVDILLDYTPTPPGSSQIVGNATLAGSSFSSVVTIPPEATPGIHRLWAQLAGASLAETTLTVLAPSEALAPSLVVINPTTNQVMQNPGVVETYPFTVRGENFIPGNYRFYIDNTSGQQLGVTWLAASSGGKLTMVLTWPRGVYGSHNVIAYNFYKRQTEASVSVMGTMLPH